MLFLLIFSRFFFMTFFFARQAFFTHNLCCKNPLKIKPTNIYHILRLPYPQIFLFAGMVENSQQWAKMKIIGGDGILKSKLLGVKVKYWGDVSPQPPGFAALGITIWLH